MKKILLLLSCAFTTMFAFGQTNVGTTTYDVQTNNSAKHRIIVYDDGRISTVWTGSTDVSGTFPDRGMFYNHYDGGWGAAPTTRAESVRTGFGEIINVEDHEVIVSHDAGANKIQIFANDAIGSNSWTEKSGSDAIRGIWPVSYCPPGTDDIYVVCADTQFITSIQFSRSDDGGDTWSILNYTVPFLTDADGFPIVTNGAENYQVAAYENHVYVLFGMINSDLVLIHSDDYGADGSWESMPIVDFPYDNYTGTVQTDTDLDGITDTINTTDGSHNMIMEDDGTLHIFSPLYRIYSDLGAFSWIVNWNTMGMWHWKTGMPAAEIIDLEMDWVDADCTGDPYTGIGASTFNYRSAANVTNPAASYDPISGRLFLLYAMKIEYTDIYDDPLNLSAQSFHDIFGCYSSDGGATWSPGVNLTNTAESGEENFYIYVNDRMKNGKIHAIWQQDNEPGHFNEGDPISTNNMLYNAWEIESFNPTLPNAAFSSAVDIGEVTFTNLSTNASGCNTWDFGDGTFSNEADPVHTYTIADTYNVCLTVENPYGSDEYCANVTVILPPDAAFTYSGDPVVTFTDLTLNNPTSWGWVFGDGGTSTLQNPVHTFVTEGTFTVCLTATNALGFEVYCLPVTIDSTELLIPAADFSVSFAGLTASFTDLSTNDPNAWAWDFGDGGTSTEQNPSHAYAVSGNYNICLTASNDFGSDENCKVINTNAATTIEAITLQMSPNPTSGLVHITASGLQVTSVLFYDVTGRQINMAFTQNNNEIIINTSNLPAGNYMIHITDGSQIGTGLLQKQ